MRVTFACNSLFYSAESVSREESFGRVFRTVGFSRMFPILAALCFSASIASAAPPSNIGPAVTSVATSQHQIALTFDDGPSPYTGQVLEILKRYHAHATFFVVGLHVLSFRDAVRAEVAAGDTVGNHTYTHADLEWLPNEIVTQQLVATQAAVHESTGLLPHWFRPPYGAVDARVETLAAAQGLRTVMWSVDPRDWSRPGTDAIVARILADVRPGSIVILHDGGGYRDETVAALPIILSSLKARGYSFVTLDDLLDFSSCNVRGALHWFAHSGFRVHPNHALYRAWEERYCQGYNLGPATGRERQLGGGLVEQDFALTGHRLIWNRRTGEVREELVWAWPSAVFGARGTAPAWHTPLTGAWFSEYFAGRDWGAALGPPRALPLQAMEEQCFTYGCGFLQKGKVQWRKSQ